MNHTTIIASCFLSVILFGAVLLIWSAVGDTATALAKYDQVVTRVPELRQQGLEAKVLAVMRDNNTGTRERVLTAIFGSALLCAGLCGLLATGKMRKAEQAEGE